MLQTGNNFSYMLGANCLLRRSLLTAFLLENGPHPVIAIISPFGWC